MFQDRLKLFVSCGVGLTALAAVLAAGCGPGAATAENRPEAATGGPASTSSSAASEINTATKSQPQGTPAAAAQPRPKLLPGAKTKVLAKAGDKPYDRTFDDIRFDMKLGEAYRRDMLTPAIEALSGQRVRIRGYILPTAQKRGITQFVLVRDNQECCFGPGAALYDCIFVEMRPGNTAEYSIRPVAVEGTFGINEIVDPQDGKYLAIYHIDGESVQ
jgi:hypothetical protein